MKNLRSSIHLFHLLVTLAVIDPAAAQAPADSRVNFSPAAGNGFMRVSVLDPGNHTWNLQISNDLTSWYDFQTIKVHNGSFATNLHLSLIHI